MFSRSMVVFAALAHRPFHRKALNLPQLSIAHTWLKRVVNFLSMQPFCCGMSGAVYSKSTPSSSCLQAFLKAIFSSAFLQHRYCTYRLYLFFKGLRKFIMTSTSLLKRNSR